MNAVAERPCHMQVWHEEATNLSHLQVLVLDATGPDCLSCIEAFTP